MDLVWIVNGGSEDLDVCNMAEKKWITFKSKRPIPVDRDFALSCIKKYPDLKACDNPDRFFNEKKIKHLIIRDAGIGDLLLLEPILRVLGETRDITVKTKFPDIYKYNPCVKDTIQILDKHDQTMFDCWDDLRNYSETAPTRSSKHRTDVYNEKFDLELKDKEPRIYIGDDEVSPVKKKEGFKYFVIQCDASHYFRRYDRGVELAEYIINADPKNIVVILGGYDFVKMPKRNSRIIDLQGKTTLREAICIIKDADYFIGGDSGLLHVACSLHTPAVGIFSIITPDLRMRYYTGSYKSVVKEGLSCIACGDKHMENCIHGDYKSKNFKSPCMDIEPKILYDTAKSLTDCDRRFFKSEISVPSIIKSVKNKITMPIIVQDEEKNLPRFIELVMSHPCIGRVIAIDGGSKDKTVELLTKAGAEVYVHPYIKTYHNMQAMQRNISCSYVADGTNILIMDLDECFSKELSDYLYFLAEQNNIEYGLISRRTFNYYADINDPSKQIKDYPDYQPRWYKWNKKFNFVGGAHHQTLNVPMPVKIQKDIIHFECEGKDREAIENQWSTMMQGVKKYGS